jgi:hypothetical protein
MRDYTGIAQGNCRSARCAESISGVKRRTPRRAIVAMMCGSRRRTRQRRSSATGSSWSWRLGAGPCGCLASLGPPGGQCCWNERANCLGLSACVCEAAPLVNDVGVDPVRQRHAGHRACGLRAFAQNLRLELGTVPPPRFLAGVFHGVHLNSMVDTIRRLNRQIQDGMAGRLQRRHRAGRRYPRWWI